MIRQRKPIAARICSVLSVLLCMSAIYLFSGQSAEESSSVSGSLIEKFAPLLNPEYRALSPAEQSAVVESMQEAVRTAAHGTIYFILGVLTATMLLTFGSSPWHSFLAAILLCLAYAVSDEIHQYFVPGRSMQFIDITVDFIGATAGAGLLSGFYRLHLLRRHKKRNM